MTTFETVRDILGQTLQLADSGRSLMPETALLDNVPEFDSMAVVSVIAALEERFDITVDDEELTADRFATVGTLTSFVDDKLTAAASHISA